MVHSTLTTGAPPDRDVPCAAGLTCRRADKCRSLAAALDCLPANPANVLDFGRAAARRRIDAFAAAVVGTAGAACCARLDVPDMKRTLAESDLSGTLHIALDAAQSVTACDSGCTAGLPDLLALIATLRATLSTTPERRRGGNGRG